jgi:hypothetical protein
MNDLVEVGAFAADSADANAKGTLVYRKWHRLRSGAQRIVLIVPATAKWAGVDPRQLLFDFEPRDNVKPVVGEGEKRGRPKASFS